MELYLCRWPNGDLSIVAGRDRQEVDYILDEVGNPDAAKLIPLPSFSVHFTLKGFLDGQNIRDVSVMDAVRFDTVGESTFSAICDAYPEIHRATLDDECPLEALNKPVSAERARYQNLKDRKPISIDPLARGLQKNGDFSLSLINAAARNAAEILERGAGTAHEHKQEQWRDLKAPVPRIECYRCRKGFYSTERNRSDVRRNAADVGWSVAVPEWAAQTPAVSKEEWWATHPKAKTVDICPACIESGNRQTLIRMRSTSTLPLHTHRSDR